VTFDPTFEPKRAASAWPPFVQHIPADARADPIVADDRLPCLSQKLLGTMPERDTIPAAASTDWVRPSASSAISTYLTAALRWRSSRTVTATTATAGGRFDLLAGVAGRYQYGGAVSHYAPRSRVGRRARGEHVAVGRQFERSTMRKRPINSPLTAIERLIPCA
jgi:hypothetical protein